MKFKKDSDVKLKYTNEVITVLQRGELMVFEDIWLKANTKMTACFGFRMLTQKEVAKILEHLSDLGRIVLFKGDDKSTGMADMRGFSQWRAKIL